MAGANIPATWFGAVGELTGWNYLAAGTQSLRQGAIHVAAHPHVHSIIAAAIGAPLVYINWGSSHHRGLKRQLMDFLVRRAMLVCANDPISQQEVAATASFAVPIVPYGVDTDFFVPPINGTREDWVFCPGSNDRDSAILLGLAERGQHVKWLNNNPKAKALYGNAHPLLELISFPDFIELRQLYQRAKCVVTPLARDLHAAGQTTTIEALSSGTPVLLSPGRTAAIFDNVPGVMVCVSQDPRKWQEAINEITSEMATWRAEQRNDLRQLVIKNWNVYTSAAHFLNIVHNRYSIY